MYLEDEVDTYQQQKYPNGIPDGLDLKDLLTEFYEAGGECTLRWVSQLLTPYLKEEKLQPFRKQFYEVYNDQLPDSLRENQVLILGKRKWEAKWVVEGVSILGGFWHVQVSAQNEKGEWVPTGGGPMRYNPQTEKEVQLVLLEMAAC